MEIKNLSFTNLKEVYETFEKAFADYIIPLRPTLEEMTFRWETQGLDLHQSYGCFDQNQMVAFTLTRKWQNGLYHMAIGVLPEYRGQHLIEQIFKELPPNAERDILEVVQENERAIKLYKKLGFEVTRELVSLKGKLQIEDELDKTFTYSIKDYQEDPGLIPLRLAVPAVESSPELLNETPHAHETHELRKAGFLLAYAHYTPKSLSLREIGSAENLEKNLDQLFLNMKLNGEDLKVMNIDGRAERLIRYFESRGLKIFVTQYEMKRVRSFHPVR